MENKNKKTPIILAIDTSCDDTSVAITRGLTVLSNVVASQTQLHKEYGGVFPTVAKQAHRENMEPSLAVALKRAQLDWAQIDAIAVTQGPGLAPALEIGIKTALKLSQEHHKPLLAINHIEAHALSVLAERKKRKLGQTQEKTLKNYTPAIANTELPVLSLVISGGHSEFILINQIGNYQQLGHTIDDAAGECLDKVGRMLGLGYPAGPALEKFAQKGNPHRFDFPLPMTTSGDFNLSFSGLKTHSKNLIKKLKAERELSPQDIFDLAAGIQFAVFRHITYKMEKILLEHPEIKSIWLGGGVAANMALRRQIRSSLQKLAKNENQPTRTLITPYSTKLCGDNAVMIGIAAFFRYYQNEFITDADSLDRKPRWKITDL